MAPMLPHATDNQAASANAIVIFLPVRDMNLPLQD